MQIYQLMQYLHMITIEAGTYSKCTEAKEYTCTFLCIHSVFVLFEEIHPEKISITIKFYYIYYTVTIRVINFGRILIKLG